MKKYHKYIVLAFLTFVFVFSTYSQKKILKKSIYFETAKFDLTAESKITIDNLTDSLKTFQTYKIYIKGNTDNIGDSIFNYKLSEQRVTSTQQYFILKGISPTVFSISAFGEEKPLADNLTEEGKQKNRRVDISISFTRPKPIDSSQFLPSIFELYKQTERKPQQFCINNSRDTFLRCEQGTIIKIKANSFKISRKCREDCIIFEVKEDYLQSDMILDNLATTSNGKMIETQGMLYLNAKDCKGNDLEIVRGRDLLIFQPTDTIIEDAKIFTGNRIGHDSDMNWTVNNTSVLSGFTMETVQNCDYWICGGLKDGGDCRCRFLFCRIKRFPISILGLFVPCNKYHNRMFRNDNRICRIKNRLTIAQSKENERRIVRLEEKLKLKEEKRQKLISKYTENCDLLPSGLPIADLPDPCKRLYELFKQYEVNNYKDLFYQLNKEQMDRFGVDNMRDLQDSLRSATRRGIEENYKSKNISFADLKYYVYNTSRFGWSNVDVFADVKPEDMVTMTVNLNAYKNTDCKLVFRDRQFVIPAETEAGIFLFKNMPKGERVWIVTLMYLNGQPYLSIEETTIDDGIHSVKFEIFTLEELREKLKILNQ
jgi:hypothetical protein